MASNNKAFRLPDVGEGLTEAEIVSWLVAPGDTVEINQIIVEIETAKSVVELPCPFAGVVAELHAAEGETVAVGRPIISVAVTSDVGDSDTDDASAAGADGDEPKLLVGYGAPDGSGRRRRRRGSGAHVAPASEVTSPPTTPDPVVAASATVRERPGTVLAKPPVRKLAKTLGVDIAAVEGSGPDGIVVRADVLRAHEAGGSPTVGAEPTVGASDEDLRIPIKGVRKHTAAAMVASAFTAPHVTEFITCDITATMELRTEIARRREFRDVKLSPLAFVASAYLRAIARTPAANSRWDEAAQEIVQYARVNLGIAAATPRGLVVPNIRDAGRLSLLELATAINDLAATARSGKTPPAAMAGGTTTITNVGVFGVDTGTPILNPGETAILAFGTVRRTPWVVDDGGVERIEPRWVTQLALSFDHRVMDGQQGSELLADTAAFLREPGLAVL